MPDAAESTIRIGDAVEGRFELDAGATWPLLRWYPTETREGQA